MPFPQVIAIRKTLYLYLIPLRSYNLLHTNPKTSTKTNENQGPCVWTYTLIYPAILYLLQPAMRKIIKCITSLYYNWNFRLDVTQSEKGILLYTLKQKMYCANNDTATLEEGAKITLYKWWHNVIEDNMPLSWELWHCTSSPMKILKI